MASLFHSSHYLDIISLLYFSFQTKKPQPTTQNKSVPKKSNLIDKSTSKSETSPKNLVGILEKQLQQEVDCQDDDKNNIEGGQGMYKNRVLDKESLKKFPNLLFLLNFRVFEIKQQEFLKKTVVLYPISIHISTL